MNRFFIRIITVILIGAFFYSCKTKNKITDTDDAAVLPENGGGSSLNIRTTLIDSLKWTLYSLNTDYEAVHYRNGKSRRVLECGMLLRDTIMPSADTTYYWFRLFYGDSSDRYIITPDNFVGLRTINGIPGGILSGIGGYVDTVPFDVAARYLRQKDSSLLIFLDSYNGNVDPWLKQEYDRRSRERRRQN